MPSLDTKLKTEPRAKPSSSGLTTGVAAAAAPLEGMPDLEHGRLSLLPSYLASRINAQNDALRARGIDVIDLGMGNPVDPVAQNVIDTLKSHLDNAANHRYAPATGIRPLKDAFARHYARQYNVALDPARDIIVSLGSKDAFSHLCLAILGTRDACVLPTPAYTPHLYAPQIAGAHVAGVFLEEEIPGQKLITDIKKIFETLRPRPKFLILNFPHNPTARTVDLPFFEEIVALARSYKFWVLNDLAYGHTCFDNYRAPSILQAKGAKDVAVEMFTMSKPYSMAGWRIGFLAGNPQVIDALSRIKPYYDYGHFIPLQLAAVVALDTGDEYIRSQSRVYQSRRDVLLSGLEKAGWGRTIRNRGTMFSWQPLPERFKSLGSLEFCAQLAEKSGVSFFPGAGFGEEGEGFVRMALVEPDERIQEATERIGKFLGS
ncbi:MAG TPA: aminotransferase class I/II-fold pyridoxal phosphate-dependent enzyme [Planctomycetota bacterium]|nr:aminotransferase class I/II-fold pyridoxal phosphate-dependent enzyme [Planctomycetota bacterium]